MSLVNLRDVGGLPLRTGGATRHGVLYRSDAPADGDAVPEHVAVWPPATVLDLRSEPEVRRTSYAWGDPTVVHLFPLHDAAALDKLPDDADLPALYKYILDTVPDRVAAAVDTVATANPAGPVLVHCTAGKDRTGIVVAALLLAADVEPEAVVADYALSAANMEALQERWLTTGARRPPDPPLRRDWLRAPEHAITEVVERLSSAPEGPVGWLVRHGGDSRHLVAWRRRIAGDPPSRTILSGSADQPRRIRDL